MKNFISKIKSKLKKTNKNKKSKVLVASTITSFILLLSFTFAWFVNIIELPFYSASTGTIGFVAKAYNSDGTLHSTITDTSKKGESVPECT